jgi:hypothetical protein
LISEGNAGDDADIGPCGIAKGEGGDEGTADIDTGGLLESSAETDGTSTALAGVVVWQRETGDRGGLANPETLTEGEVGFAQGLSGRAIEVGTAVATKQGEIGGGGGAGKGGEDEVVTVIGIDIDTSEGADAGTGTAWSGVSLAEEGEGLDSASVARASWARPAAYFGRVREGSLARL